MERSKLGHALPAGMTTTAGTGTSGLTAATTGGAAGAAAAVASSSFPASASSTLAIDKRRKLEEAGKESRIDAKQVIDDLIKSANLEHAGTEGITHVTPCLKCSSSLIAFLFFFLRRTSRLRAAVEGHHQERPAMGAHRQQRQSLRRDLVNIHTTTYTRSQNCPVSGRPFGPFAFLVLNNQQQQQQQTEIALLAFKFVSSFLASSASNHTGMS